jgi:hypothetical protein
LYLSRLSNSGQLTLPDFYQRALPRDARLAVIPIGEVLVIVPYDDAFAEMAVREQTHRHKQERTKLPADIVVQLLGLLVAAGIAGGGIYFAWDLFSKGHAVGGARCWSPPWRASSSVLFKPSA